jgi:hypothetical protein
MYLMRVFKQYVSLLISVKVESEEWFIKLAGIYTTAYLQIFSNLELDTYASLLMLILVTV